jgi:hypothetical protein
MHLGRWLRATDMALACDLDVRTDPSRRVVAGTFLAVGGPGIVPCRGLAGCEENRAEGRSGSVVVAER